MRAGSVVRCVQVLDFSWSPFCLSFVFFANEWEIDCLFFFFVERCVVLSIVIIPIIVAIVSAYNLWIFFSFFLRPRCCRAVGSLRNGGMGGEGARGYIFVRQSLCFSNSEQKPTRKHWSCTYVVVVGSCSWFCFCLSPSGPFLFVRYLIQLVFVTMSWYIIYCLWFEHILSAKLRTGQYSSSTMCFHVDSFRIRGLQFCSVAVHHIIHHARVWFFVGVLLLLYGNIVFNI